MDWAVAIATTEKEMMKLNMSRCVLNYVSMKIDYQSNTKI